MAVTYAKQIKLPDGTIVILRDGTKTIAFNPALTAASGEFTWTISDAALTDAVPGSITIYDSNNNIVYPNIATDISGNIIITIKDTDNQSTLAASTYKAVLIR